MILSKDRKHTKFIFTYYITKDQKKWNMFYGSGSEVITSSSKVHINVAELPVTGPPSDAPVSSAHHLCYKGLHMHAKSSIVAEASITNYKSVKFEINDSSLRA